MAKNSSMTGDKLESDLGWIGKACFVKHFDLFANLSLSRDEVAEELQRREPQFKYTGCELRTAFATGVIRAGRAEQALIAISASKKVPPEIAERARSLAEKLKSRLPGPCDNDKRC